jgi:hypothetical protein
MVQVDLDSLLRELFLKAEDFIAEPSLRKGLDLDELAGRASSACSSRFGTRSGLVACLFEFMQAIPGQDRRQLQRLLDEIRTRLEGLRGQSVSGGEGGSRS